MLGLRARVLNFNQLYTLESGDFEWNCWHHLLNDGGSNSTTDLISYETAALSIFITCFKVCVVF